MSPALQGNLEVERYIGSYLISQRIPPNVKSSTASKRYQNQQHQKQKSLEAEKAQRNFNKYCFPQRDHHVGGPSRYPMPPLPVDCQGYTNHYGKHSPGGSGWAGVPLISMTSGNHRRNKKVSPTTNPNQVQKYSIKPAQPNCFAKGKDSEVTAQFDSDRSPLTRLAIHTQGAPLIQAGRLGNHNNRCRNNFNRDQATRVFRNEGVRWEAAKDAKTTASAQNKEQPCGNIDNASVASDESSGNSENSLPRIIKPRKRRKKDRKPITGTNPVPATASNESPRELEQKVESKALNTFLPICFDKKAANIFENNTSITLSNNSNVLSFEDKQSEDLIDPLTSADEFPFGNLLDDEEDSHGECAPATLCQCRYCDPSGVIWDVDQRCYSPFLTPPSPSDKLHFNNSLPLNFDSFCQIGRPYHSQATPSSSAPSQYFNGDLTSLLRRSWSDPSPYKNLENVKSLNSECCIERSDLRPTFQGLQVSSEIITSPNGHRDIEIKFFSSAPPDPSKVKFSASDNELNGRCFGAEE